MAAEVRVKRLSRVVVYCGAQEGKNPIFGEKAAELGSYLAAKHIGIVYGGSRYGCLGKMADAAAANGGSVTAIVPEFFTRMKDYDSVVEEIIVPDMHTRKKMMFDKGDAFIALPGGVGTMEELTEMLTWAKLSLHSKPIALLNVEGFYDHFLLWLSRAIEEGFIPRTSSADKLMIVAETPKDLVDRLCQTWSEANQ